MSRLATTGRTGGPGLTVYAPPPVYVVVVVNGDGDVDDLDEDYAGHRPRSRSPSPSNVVDHDHVDMDVIGEDRGIGLKTAGPRCTMAPPQGGH